MHKYNFSVFVKIQFTLYSPHKLSSFVLIRKCCLRNQNARRVLLVEREVAPAGT